MKTINSVYTQLMNINCLGKKDAPSIVFIHDIGSSLSNWVFHYSILLMHKYKCVSYDLRGHGRSFYPQTGYMLKNHVQDLMSIYDQHPAGFKTIIGHGYGGNIALKWALNHATEDDTLILLNTPDLPIPNQKIHEFIDNSITVHDNDFRYESNFTLKISNSFRNSEEVIHRPAENYKKRLIKLAKTSFVNEIIQDQSFSDEELSSLKCKILMIYAFIGSNMDFASRMIHKAPNCKLITLKADHQMITTHNKEIIEISKPFFNS